MQSKRLSELLFKPRPPTKMLEVQVQVTTKMKNNSRKVKLRRMTTWKQRSSRSKKNCLYTESQISGISTNLSRSTRDFTNVSKLRSHKTSVSVGSALSAKTLKSIFLTTQLPSRIFSLTTESMKSTTNSHGFRTYSMMHRRSWMQSLAQKTSRRRWRPSRRSRQTSWW